MKNLCDIIQMVMTAKTQQDAEEAMEFLALLLENRCNIPTNLAMSCARNQIEGSARQYGPEVYNRIITWLNLPRSPLLDNPDKANILEKISNGDFGTDIPISVLAYWHEEQKNEIS